MRHLTAVEDAVNALHRDGEAVPPFQKYVPIWTAMLLNYPNAWAGVAVTPRAGFSPSGLDMLETLGSFI